MNRVDDTLITCAEYQLFLDEMRVQGKYHQPDHWASDQFPVGQARAPVLGVRYSDAEAFCAWLTQHEGGEWRFRLPTAEEAATRPLEAYSISPLGYWLAGKVNEDRFAWNGTAPLNPRSLDLNLAQTLARDRDSEVDLDRELALALARHRTRPLDLTRALDLAHTLALVLDREHDPALDLAIDAALARTFEHDPAIDRARARDLALDLARALARARDLERARARDLQRTLNLDLDRARDFYFNLALDIFLDFVTLQERIAGRSPAFEGIRILKERGNVSH